MGNEENLDIINKLFDTLDSWRHLPNYQLERRADIFFAMYLKGVLEWKYGVELKPEIVPEFPVRIGSIHGDDEYNNKSFKIDYVLFSQDGKAAYLVELKTDDRSRRDGQDNYLKLASKAGMSKLLGGIGDIYCATSSKDKYGHLLALLQAAGQIEVSSDEGRKNLVRSDIRVTSEVEADVNIVYIQPNGSGEGCINFTEFADFVETRPSPVSTRFASSLRQWAERQAGR